MVSGKRGWIRTLEAVIAILLIFGFILYITPTTTVYAERTPQIVESAQNFILKNVLEVPEFRNCILDANLDSYLDGGDRCSSVLGGCGSGIINLINTEKPIGYSYDCELCKKSTSCISVEAIKEKSVFTSAIFVSKKDSLGTRGKVMRIYFWET